jgi:hypothetical protein
MIASYKILFSIELLHPYYSDGKCIDFAIIPSAATKKLFQNNQLVYKMQDNELWVLIKVNVNGQPYIPLTPEQKFVFYLQLVQPQFMTVTNLDADAFANNRFYFSNLSRNQAGTNLYLSQPIPAYSPLVHYYPGMFAAGAGNIVYESIKENPAGAGVSHNTTDEAFWMPRGSQPFVSRSDMVHFSDSTMRLQVAEAAQYGVKAFALNKADNRTYNIAMPIARENPLSVGEVPASGAREVQADFSALPPGRYKVGVNEQEKETYVDDAASGFFGVVEIFNHLEGTNPFALLDAEGKVKDTVIAGRPTWQRYTIRFANRLAYLKYISLNRGVQTITDGRPVAQRQFSFAANPVSPPLPAPPPHATLFLSNKPVPMQQQLDIFNLSMPAVFGTGTLKAPNPNPMLPGVLSRYEQDYYCTVMLNY